MMLRYSYKRPKELLKNWLEMYWESKVSWKFWLNQGVGNLNHFGSFPPVFNRLVY